MSIVLLLADTHGRSAAELLKNLLSSGYEMLSYVNPSAKFSSFSNDIEKKCENFNFNNIVFLVRSNDINFGQTNQGLSMVFPCYQKTNIIVSTIPCFQKLAFWRRVVEEANSFIHSKIFGSVVKNKESIMISFLNERSSKKSLSYSGLYLNLQRKEVF